MTSFAWMKQSAIRAARVWARRGLRVACLAALVCVLSSQVQAQAVDASQWSAGTVDLNDGWRTHAGDDPSWAQPGFDDGGWETVNLDELGASQVEWRWFRLHVKLPHGHMHEHLLVVGGEGVYEAFVNGQAVRDAQLEPWYAVRRPVEEVIPLRDDEDDFTLALRTHAQHTYTIWHLPLFLTVAVGSADAIDNERVSFESQRLYGAIPSILINLVVVFAGIGAFALYRSQRGHTEYLWLGLYLVLLGISNGLLYCSGAGMISLALNNLVADPLIYLFTLTQVQFTFRFAGQRVGRMWRSYEILLLAGPVLSCGGTLGLIPNTWYVLIEALMILPAALLLPVLLLLWNRRGNREAGWLILPSLLPAATSASFDVGNASVFAGWDKLNFLLDPVTIGPVPLQISDIGDFLFVLAIGVVMFFRFTRVSREQMRGAAELEAAREIQQRLVPAQLPEVPGYVLEAAYFPAQEVGGDFYQVMKQPDGAQLIVVGDVSGKGLKAAMTGTLALGALRALSHEPLGPGAMLTRLNQQLVETAEGGFITCVCLRLERDGELTVANAGHLAPYRNGEELRVEQSLPLGIVAGATYADDGLRMEPGDRLTLMSDGVVEARDARGELFGFERTRGIVGARAEAIAAAAQQHGQEDDITVVTVERKAEIRD